MIRFCDKAVYVLHPNQMSRSELLLFFQNGHYNDVIQYVAEDGSHIGVLFYERLLKYDEIAEAVLEKVLNLGDAFWEDAGAYFQEHMDDLVPVVNGERELQGFAYCDKRNDFDVESALASFEEDDGSYIFLENKYPFLRQVCIYDINEVAYRVYTILKKRNVPVTVIGEKWEWFLIKQFEDYNKYSDYEKYHIYAEGTSAIRERIGFGSLTHEIAINNFMFLADLGLDNMRELCYEALKNFMEQGIHVAKFTFPLYEQIDFVTSLEQKSNERGVTFSVNSKNEEKRNITYEIFGKDVCEDMAANQDYFFEKTKNFYFIEELRVYQTVEGIGKRIYVIGPCIVSGLGAKTEDCLIAQIQKLVGSEYIVVAVPIDALRKFGLYKKLNKLPIRKKDIVVFIDEGLNQKKYKEDNAITQFSLIDIFNNKERPTLFSDKPIHANKTNHYLCAKYIYDIFLKAKMEELSNEKDNLYIQKGEVLTEEHRTMVDHYLKKIKEEKFEAEGTIGSIVMNCNPFTLGHQHLIEYAAKTVDYLYIFAVEENKSEFLFQDRFAMIVEGTRHLENVTVVPSGEFILSHQTLAVYFLKEQKVDAKVDASQDLEIFGRYIAPPLHISVRFVGEEPLDAVTRQYNEQMKQILKLHSIELIEIPRKEWGGNVISASKVRKCLKLKEYDVIQEIVPRTTYEYLIKMGLIPDDTDKIQTLR